MGNLKNTLSFHVKTKESMPSMSRMYSLHPPYSISQIQKYQSVFIISTHIQTQCRKIVDIVWAGNMWMLGQCYSFQGQTMNLNQIYKNDSTKFTTIKVTFQTLQKWYVIIIIIAITRPSNPSFKNDDVLISCVHLLPSLKT